jgi:hypothetical protein
VHFINSSFHRVSRIGVPSMNPSQKIYSSQKFLYWDNHVRIHAMFSTC